MRLYNGQALSQAEIQRAAASAFAVQPYYKQSSRYTFIPTSNVIEGMREAGFQPVMASQSRTRVEGKQDFTKHMIRFRAPQANNLSVGDSLLEAVLINSHDGSSAYKLMLGVFRLVCSNGMVVADSFMESIRIRHTGNVIQEVIEGTQRIFERDHEVMEVVGKWQSIQLKPVEQLALAQSAHVLRFDEESPVTAEMLLTARRYNDQGSDLWSTFNRIQENSLKGFRTRQRDTEGRRISARAVKSIDGDVKLNRALWTLATSMAEIKSGS